MKTSIFVIAIILSLGSCLNSKTKKVECQQDGILELYYENEPFYVSYSENSIENVKSTLYIFHIRDAVIIDTLKFSRDYNYKEPFLSWIIIEPNQFNLSQRDTIQIKRKNKKDINIHSFRSLPQYGGKKFLGCYYEEYHIENDTTAYKNLHGYSIPKEQCN